MDRNVGERRILSRRSEERWCRCTVARRGRGGGGRHKRRNCIGPARWLDFNRSATYKVAENQIIPARPVPHPPPLATSFSLPPSLSPSPRSLLSGWPRLRTIFFFLSSFFLLSLSLPHPRFFISRIFIDSCKSNVRYPPLRRGRANSKPRLELEEGEGGIVLSLSTIELGIKIGIARGPFFFLSLFLSFRLFQRLDDAFRTLSSVVARECKSKQ